MSFSLVIHAQDMFVHIFNLLNGAKDKKKDRRKLFLVVPPPNWNAVQEGKPRCDSFCFLTTANNKEPSQGLTKQITAIKNNSCSSPFNNMKTIKLSAISSAKCKAFSSKIIALPTDMKEGLAVKALNRQSICPPLATAQWQPQRDSAVSLSPSLSYKWLLIMRALRRWIYIAE